ncbi:ATP-binding cassette domain-containing protein [Roseobacter fucihabitans]|nr:ATP-binding cassette domain-containing protein [Roseobacter litoralis]
MPRVDNLDLHYGQNLLLYDISLEVGRGQIIALMGKAGVGKPSLLKVIFGRQPGNSGKIAMGIQS